MVFTVEHNTFIVMAYFRSGEYNPAAGWQYSVAATYPQFQEMYPELLVAFPVFQQHCMRVVDRFINTGSVQKGKPPGRPSTLTDEVVEDIRERMEQDPNKSIQKLSLQSGLSYGSCSTVLKKKLRFHPYKYTRVQTLLPPDYERRIEFCNWFNQNLNNDDILDRTFFSDEAWFELGGYVNSQNYRYWSGENPHVFRTTTLHPIKVGVWVAVSRRRIIGPIFYNYTINSNRYVHNILDPFIQQLDDQELHHGYFQNDNATAHTARYTMQFLRQYFDVRIIGAGTWPSRSPDLTPLDFFFFGHVKDEVFRNEMHTAEELQEAITQEIANITPNMLVNVFESL